MEIGCKHGLTLLQTASYNNVERNRQKINPEIHHRTLYSYCKKFDLHSRKLHLTLTEVAGERRLTLAMYIFKMESVNLSGIGIEKFRNQFITNFCKSDASGSITSVQFVWLLVGRVRIKNGSFQIYRCRFAFGSKFRGLVWLLFFDGSFVSCIYWA